MNIFKSSTKRLNSEGSDEGPPLKRRRLSHDPDWIKLKAEIGDIRSCLREIVEHLKGEMDLKLDDILHELRQ